MLFRFLLLIVFTFLPLIVLAQDEEPATPPTKANKRPVDQSKPAPEPFDKATVKDLKRCVDVNTSLGKIVLEMFPVTAPETVRNFLNLTAIGAFDQTTFSRIVPGFVIQGGNLFVNADKSNELKKRSLRNIPDEPNLVRHERGILSMARSDEPNSASSDFFILVASAPALDNKFAAFGRVAEGMDLVDKINKMPVDGETPKEPVVISKMAIVECVDRPVDTTNINDLPRFGLRGAVKNVRETTENKKSKKKKKAKSDDHRLGHSLTEFGPNGNYLKATFFEDGGGIRGTNTAESTIWDKRPDAKAKDFFRDASGKIVAQTHVQRTSPTSFSFRSYDENMKLVREGNTETDDNGRFLKQSYKRFGPEGSADGSFVNTMT